MSPKDYRVSGNSFVYELSDDSLNGIKSIIVALDDD
jgi:hypothetical protein